VQGTDRVDVVCETRSAIRCPSLRNIQHFETKPRKVNTLDVTLALGTKERLTGRELTWLRLDVQNRRHSKQHNYPLAPLSWYRSASQFILRELESGSPESGRYQNSKPRQHDTASVIPTPRLSRLHPVAGVERRIRTLGTGVSPCNGLAKHRASFLRRVFNHLRCCECFSVVRKALHNHLN